MARLIVEKFPELDFEGRRLIWDSRQPVSGGPELVILPGEPGAVREALRKRGNARFVGEIGSGCDVEAADARRFLGEAASLALGEPSVRLKVLAVTGTNGKTTCASIMRALLVADGKGVCEIGTLGISLWRPGRAPSCERHETGFTTPESPTLHHIFSQLPALGITHVVMEASSHGIALRRIAGVDFDGALFTNLTLDHLDFHGSWEAYERAKTELFTDFLPGPSRPSRKEKWAVINTGDPAGARILAHCPEPVNAASFERGKSFKVLRNDLSGLEIETDFGFSIRTPLVGAYNAENAVGAALLCQKAAGVSPSAMADAFAAFKGAPGRMDRVHGPPAAADRHVFVDYAHTPDALEKTLSVLNEVKGPAARLWVVFGCGGDRDRSKRPLMGGIAARIAEFVVLTSDNPRSEDPLGILAEIQGGVPLEARAHTTLIESRRAAIEFALRGMQSGDVCLVAGKGHENFQVVGGRKLAFSDWDVCRSVLAALG